jgi:hypothetical protein
MRKTVLRAFVVSSIWVWAAGLGGTRVALAGDQTITVLGLEPAAGAPESVATAVTEALRQRVTATGGYRLVQGRDLVEVKLVFSCPDEAPPCMTQAAQSIGATKVVFGNVQPVGMDAFLITLKLLDGERGVVETWISEQITKAQTTPVALRGPVQKWFATLTGQAVPGSIKVTGGVVGAAVWIDGMQAGLLGGDGLTITGVAAGPHQVAVSKSGYEKFERNVTLASGAAERVAVQLKSIQSGEAVEAVRPEASSLTTAPTAPEDAASGTNGAAVAGFALLGVGIVAVGGGIYSSWRVSDVNSKLDPLRRYNCASGGPATCSADGKEDKGALTPDQVKFVNDQKDAGDSYALWQWVGYGVGAAAFVGAAVCLYHGFASNPSSTAAIRRRSNLIVMPSFGPNNAGAAAYMRF